MKHLKHLRTCALIASSIAFGASVHAQIAISPGPAPATPNTKAMLDLNDVSRGFLAPRFTYANRPAGPANSLLYYQTDSSTVTGEGRGYYYWDNTLVQWVHASMGAGWRVGGNSGTSPLSNFIGTTNNVAMRIRTNGVERINLNTTGQVQVGPAPYGAVTDQLEVNGALRVYTTSVPSSDATPVEGAIRYNNTTGAHEGYVNDPLVGGQIQYVGWYQLENAFKTRVKQKFPSVPVAACVYPAPGTVPAGPTAGSWLTIDDPLIANIANFATTETPYSTFWEDGRHQYLYLSSDLQALGLCPNTDVRAIAFQTSAASSGIGFRNIKVRMKNESSSSLTDFIYSGLVDCASIAAYPNPVFQEVTGWNAHQFNLANWQWTGIGQNMLVEFCFDNQDWTYNVGVNFENMPYNATYGLYCDACGSPIPGGQTCYYVGPCPSPVPSIGVGFSTVPYNAPAGPSSTSSGTLCTGWGWNGFAGGGCAWTSTTSLVTCDGSFQYTGFKTSAARRPILKIDGKTSGVTTSYVNASYLLSQDGVMIGDYASWANSGLYGSCAAYQFKGPGTLAARSSVWGGTVLLSDHVFDQYYDGKIKPEDAKQAMGYRHYPMKEMSSYVERERHLPTIAGRDQWNQEGLFSVDQLTNQLWVTVETQSLYIKELNDRMNALQNYLVEKRLKELRK